MGTKKSKIGVLPLIINYLTFFEGSKSGKNGHFQRFREVFLRKNFFFARFVKMNRRFISTNRRFDKIKRRFVFIDYQLVTRMKIGNFVIGVFLYAKLRRFYDLTKRVQLFIL